MDPLQPNQVQHTSPIPHIQTSTPATQPTIQVNQADQIIDQLRAELKAQFDEEWFRREAMLQRELESARAARAELEAELREAQQRQRDQSMAPPEQVPPSHSTLRTSHSPQAMGRTPSSVRNRIPLPYAAPTFNLAPPGRGTQREAQLFVDAGSSAPTALCSGQTADRSASPPRRDQRSTQSPSRPGPPPPNHVNRNESPDDSDDAMEDDNLPSLGELEDELEDGLQEVGHDGPKDRRQEFQLKRTDLPAGISGFKMAFIMHLRILWRLLHARDIPPDPTAATLDTFNKRFRSTSSIDIQRQCSTLLVAIHCVRGVRHLANSIQSESKILKFVCKMEEHIILYIDSYIARFGLEEWCPDFKQSPYSLYNATHRIIAIDTFKQAVVSHAYASLKPNLKFAHDMDLLQKLYNHYVHYYFYLRYTRELDNPGSLSAVSKASPAYRNRSQLCKARRDWLASNGFHRYLPLVTRKSTLDDERDPEGRRINGRPLFFIKTRPERSPQVTRLFRILDAKREQQTQLGSSRRPRERMRRDPPGGPVETAFPSIPVNMPADYFDPAFFNDLPPKLRAQAAIPHVSLLPNVENSLTRCADELLSQAQFNNKYARERLAQYDMVDDPDLMPGDDSLVEDDGNAEGVA